MIVALIKVRISYRGGQIGGETTKHIFLQHGGG
jgi:hypothetical protein